MKPDFALEFTDKSVVLLHRTARGWLNIGEAALDAADLDGALEYLRKTALELAPGGFTTKLVIPEAQILYAEIPVPNGSEREIRAAITEALVARTPYRADEIAFDWAGSQGVAQVAAVARQTLGEAEGFAIQHRLNPASFVAIPPDAAFDGEPFFGTAPGLRLPEGESLERDDSAIVRVGEGPRSPRARTARKDTARDAAESPAVPRSAASAAGAGAASAAGAAAAGEARRQAAGTTAGEAGPDPEKAPASPPSHAVPSHAMPSRAGTESSHAEAASRPGAGQAGAAPRPEAPSRPAASPAAAAALVAETAGEAPFVRVPDPEAASAGAAHAANGHAAGALPHARPRTPEVRPPDTHAGTLARAQAGPADSLPPAPAPAILAARAARAGGATPGPTSPGSSSPGPSSPGPAPPGPARSPAPAHLEGPGLPGRDAPPAVQPGAEAPHRPAPGAVPGPAAAAAPAGEGGQDRPAPAPSAGPPAPQAAPPARPHARVKAVPRAGAAQRAQASAPAAAGEAARTLAHGPIVSRQGQRGKPRHLGLILTAILLLCLALVAAWSSFYLASETPSARDPVSVAGAGGATGTLTQGEDLLAAPLPDEATDEALADAAGADEAAGGQDMAASGDPSPVPAVVGETPEAAHPAGPAEVALIASTDSAPTAFDLLKLPQPASPAEAAPAAPMPPPPEGMVYQFDTDGLIVPVPEGIPSPDGYTIRAGQPPRVPPARSAELEAAAAATVATVAAAMAPDSAAAVSPAGAAGESAGPALAEASGQPSPGAGEDAIASGGDAGAGMAAGTGAAPEGATTGATMAADTGDDTGADTGADTGDGALSEASGPDSAPLAASGAEDDIIAGDDLVVDPGLASARPRPRPEPPAPATADDDASVVPDEARDFASMRPRARSGTAQVAAEAEGAREQTAAASLAGGLAAAAPEPAVLRDAPDAGAEAGADAGTAANPALVTVALRPAARPAGLSRAVDAAVSAALQEPQPTAIIAQPSAEESAEIDEPEIAAASAPSIPTRANVAREATVTKAFALSKTSLIGVYGTPSNRHALIRMGNGKIAKVKVGDKLEGGVVQAITQDEVRYQKGKKLYALAMPAG